MMPILLRKQVIDIFNEKRCLAPRGILTQCSNVIVSAHTIQRSNELNAISEDNHVIGVCKKLGKILGKAAKNHITQSPERISSKSASTFFGFCETHDSTLWCDIEVSDYVLNSWTAFLHGYRSICREYYLKTQALKSFHAQEIEGKKKRLADQRMSFIHANKMGTQAAVRALERIKEIYDEIYLKKQSNSYRYYCIEFLGSPTFQANGSSSVNESPAGCFIQDNPIFPEWYAMLNVSTIFTGNSTAYVFGYLECDENTLRPYFDYLDSATNEIEVAFPIISIIENVYFRESWWNSLCDLVKIEIEDKFGLSQLSTLVRGSESETRRPGYDFTDYKLNSELCSKGFNKELSIKRNQKL